MGTFFLLLYLASEFFIDKRVLRPINMSLYTVSGFYSEPKNTLDIVAIGSSQCYTSVIPAILWRDYGWTAYDFCVEQQPFVLSYYYIKEVIKRQPHALILLEVGESRPRSDVADEVIYVNLNNLPLSFNKLSAIYATNRSTWFDYLFTLNKYHPTWKELSRDKIGHVFYTGKSASKGYGEYIEQWWEEGHEPKDYDLSQTDIEPLAPQAERYLLKIIAYAKEQHVRLVFYKAPSSNLNIKRRVNAIKDISKKHGIPFVDFNEQMKGQHHLTLPQAEQMTVLLGDYLAKRYSFSDKRKELAYADWNQTVGFLKQQKLKYDVSRENDLVSLFDKLKNNPNYLIFISVRDSAVDEGRDVNQNVIAAWQHFGLNPNVLMANHFRNSYIMVMNAGKIIYEQISPERLSWRNAFAGMGRISIESAGLDKGNFSSIRVNNQELSPNKRGINIVVYDKWMKDFVLQTAFDTFLM